MENAKMNEYEQFKHLLEYFVTHLEWLVNKDVTFPGYMAYLKHLISQNNFYATGQGYKGANIQKQIQNWDIYSEGRIYINMQPNFGDYKTRKCYLTWQGTGLNVIADWDNNHVASLQLEEYQYWTKKKKRIDLGVCNTLTDLGLFDGTPPNETLKQFFNKYADLIIDWNEQEKRSNEMEQIKPYIELLKANKNIILTGAPGTGKTYLAKRIAMAIIDVNSDEELEKSNQYAFVQFHPSYDYTDFVEGLRPKSDGNNNIGFELKNGIFKDFCKRAIENFDNSKKSQDVIGYVHTLNDQVTKETEYTFSNGLVCIDDSNRGGVFYAVRKGRSGYSQLISTEDVAEWDIQTTSDVTVVTKLRGVGGHSPNNLFWEVATAHTGGGGKQSVSGRCRQATEGKSRKFPQR